MADTIKIKCACCGKPTDALPLDDGHVLCDECREKLPVCDRCGCYANYIYLYWPEDRNEETDQPVAVCGTCCTELDLITKSGSQPARASEQMYILSSPIRLT
jgi:hypothetical protein